MGALLARAPRSTWRSFPRTAESVNRARRFSLGILMEEPEIDQAHLDSVMIAVSELVTNAVRHTDGSLLYAGIAALPRWTHVFVEDLLPKVPAPVPIGETGPDGVDDLSLSGRGMAIIDALTERFQFVVREDGKTAHAVVLRTDVALVDQEQKVLDRLARVILRDRPARHRFVAQEGGRRTNMATAPVTLPVSDPHDELLRPREVAEIFGVRPATVARWAREGKLTPWRTPGGHRRYSHAAVRGVLARMLEPNEDERRLGPPGGPSVPKETRDGVHGGGAHHDALVR
jgi:excisionase family DNA binding protein